MSSTKQLLSWCAACCIALGSLSCSSKKKGELEPLAASSWRVELAVPGFGPASVALPLGSKTPRPIVVVLHGGADRADWQCGSFRGVFGGRVFVVCPQGVARPELGERFGWGNEEQTTAELRAALKALKARFGGHVAPSPIVLVGYAEGVALAADIARQEPSFFQRVALVQGSPQAVSPMTAAVLSRNGGKRVLFFCADAVCQGDGVQRASLLTRAGLAAKSVQREVGPYLDAAFTKALSSEMAWLLEGDSRFSKR